MGKKFTPESGCHNRTAAKMKKTGRNLFACAVITLMVAFAALHVQAADTNSGNAKQAVGNTVWFGSYPQEYTREWAPNYPAPTAPYVLKPNHRERDGQQPPQMRSCYFLVQPVEWNVMAIDAQGILLVAAENLDVQPYHTSTGSVKWSASSLRAWLENDFLLGS
ncbi:MAG: DUF6273 domain-containing protein, partial [Tannerella sp.]|nr:DUF6273 domain-containing protein [Tannerella sp.]